MQRHCTVERGQCRIGRVLYGGPAQGTVKPLHCKRGSVLYRRGADDKRLAVGHQDTALLCYFLSTKLSYF